MLLLSANKWKKCKMSCVLDCCSKSSLMFGTQTIPGSTNNLPSITDKFLQVRNISIPRIFFLFTEVTFFWNSYFLFWYSSFLICHMFIRKVYHPALPLLH